MIKILDTTLTEYRTKIDLIVGELHDLTKEIGHQELETTVSDLRDRIKEPFMFVIVGEVKAGKSSFINALLESKDKEICKVAASPMTDTIQQITYGEVERVVAINDYLKRIYQPVEILKEISIVDTPGTNTIVDHHQEITERFIPASDLIVFVFESKNPYRQSAWDFFNFIHEDWRKKIIFILQQKDLMVPDDLVTNINGVREYAQKKGIEDPKIFAVSAKQELEGHPTISGYEPLRDYIAENITGGKAPVLKLTNNIETSRNINQKIYKGVAIRKDQYNADVRFRDDIRETLDKQEKKSANQVDILVENLIATYDRITNKREKELMQGLGFFSLVKRSIFSVWKKEESAKDWLNGLAGGLEKDLNNSLKDKLNDGVVDIADSIQQMGKMIDLKLKNSETILKDNHEIFSDIAERRTNVLRELQETFSKFLKHSENFHDDELFPDKETISPNIATGSGIAVIGIILATVTNGMVFDITGGILTTIGFLFAGVSIGMKRKKILEGYQSEISKGRTRLESEVTEKLKTYIANIKLKIDRNFHNFDDMLKREEESIARFEKSYESIEERLVGMTREIEEAVA